MQGAVIYVKDASRSVGVCQQLVTQGTRDAYVATIKAEHERRREQHRNKSAKAPQLSLAAGAREEIQDRLGRLHAAGPELPGRADLRGLSAGGAACRTSTGCRSSMPGNSPGSFPDILTDPVVGEAASNLYADAQTHAASSWSRRNG